jgi:hypothetical protein
MAESWPSPAKGAAEFIVSLLPPPPPRSLREKLEDAIADYDDGERHFPEALASTILEIVRLDLKENFGWETRITSYLKGQ